MPVPSTMTGLRLTMVLILCGRVASAQPFIITGGPIATHSSMSRVLRDRLPDAVGDEALDAGRAVVGAEDQLVAAGAELVLPEDQVAVAEAEDADDVGAASL